MTREERDKAIRILQWLHDNDFLFRSTEEDVKYATKLAIQELQKEPCEDAISREWLKTAIHNFYYGLKHTPTEEDIQAFIDAAPSISYSEKSNRCEDAISRQAAIECCRNEWEEEAAERIKQLPPVSVAEKVGTWKHFAWSDDCSECGWSTGKYGSPTKYCPNCGAKMGFERR